MAASRALAHANDHSPPGTVAGRAHRNQRPRGLDRELDETVVAQVAEKSRLSRFDDGSRDRTGLARQVQQRQTLCMGHSTVRRPCTSGAALRYHPARNGCRSLLPRLPCLGRVLADGALFRPPRPFSRTRAPRSMGRSADGGTLFSGPDCPGCALLLTRCLVGSPLLVCLSRDVRDRVSATPGVFGASHAAN